MAKGLTVLADLRREEHFKSLMELSDRDLCEMIRAHFESHPSLPGEKVIKDEVNQRISQLDIQVPYAQENGFVPAAHTPFDNENATMMTPEEKENLARKYAQTRIRETSLNEGLKYLDFHNYDPTALKRNQVDQLPQEGQADIIIERVNVELQRMSAGDVSVIAEQSDGTYRRIGSLPENFLKNNPMNVESCSAELQLADYSNGSMKNLSAKIVVDTDLMSGDVIDLTTDLISGIDQSNGLEQ